ncbi:hypothetical protein [Yersinia enterocolitica]|uniref:hypothetical protein n=1 Tax=Yersinia enterocolitica TaxID=630 RepID=UPI003CFBDCE5
MNNIEELREHCEEMIAISRMQYAYIPASSIITLIDRIEKAEKESKQWYSVVEAAMSDDAEWRKQSNAASEAIGYLTAGIVMLKERAEKAEAALSAASEKLKGEPVPVEYQYRYHNHGTGCGEWCRVLTKERYEELQREHAGDNDFVFRMLFTAPQKPVALLDKYVRNEKGQYILDGKCEPRIGFAVGWNAAIRAAGGKVEGNADEK